MKAKAEGKRLISVKVSDEVRALVMEVSLARMRQGRPYSETTNSAIVEDGIRDLALKEMGKTLPAQPVDVSSIPKVLRAMKLAEHFGYPVNEQNVASIEKAMLEKGEALPYQDLLTLPEEKP